ncbi:MAG: HAD-IB family hydrolase, partial [Deltaproteobacteria bacterium]|nr:HAD-IB family hydrolase [Deltaproteobacteria bacterium]
FFDLDGTLLTANSGGLWMRSERRQGRISFWQLIQGTIYLAAYKFSVLDMDKVMTKALQTVKGVEVEIVRQRTHDWYKREVARYAAPGAEAVLADHRAKGHRLVLHTSSSPYESEIASQQFKLDAFISSRFESEGGILTGRLDGPACYGKGKVVLAEKYARQHDIDLDASYFYTDSHSDLPMLERVSHPMVVHPDPRLRRLAKKRDWPILDWH